MPSTPRPVVRVRVPGKINLHLSVGPPRPDRFHDLQTVFHAVDLYDDVVVSAADAPSITVTGITEGVPTDRTNIAWRAVELMAAELGVEPAVRLRIHKRIPVAGGMAGGSADAAGTLLACNALWGRPAIRAERLEQLAAQLGSDVTFPLYGGTAVGAGRGEVLAPIACPPMHWVIVPAAYGISAGQAYAELDRLRAAGTPLPAAPLSSSGVARHLSGLTAEQGVSAATVLHNDLQAVALSLRPELAEILDPRDDFGDAARLICGSGPSCALLYRTRVDAERAQRRLGPRFPGAVAASGPVEPMVCVS